MGSVASISIAIESGIILALGLLAVLRKPIRVFGLLWIAMALFDFSILIWGNDTRWSDIGNYLIVITAMLWITIHRLPQPEHPPR